MNKYDAVKLDLIRINNFHPSPRSYKFCSLITCIYRQFEEFKDGYLTEQEILQEIKSSYGLSYQ